MDKIQILHRLSELEDQYQTASKEDKCAIDKERRELGTLLTDKDRVTKVKNALRKGPEMAYSDVEFLLNNEIGRTEILDAIGLNINKRSKVDFSSAKEFYRSLNRLM
ncbi:hypothetical protein [Virgibacillus salexigens]|uniref:hypothetical protein n=1 Tax=Virgibacillus TaxID=84406 RepID=UPI0013684A95|nr:hypothetical protein [Virgibacillus massiliensis]MYL41798.1 hypothetical protein [Virgibacillus massiliensis]